MRSVFSIARFAGLRLGCGIKLLRDLLACEKDGLKNVVKYIKQICVLFFITRLIYIYIFCWSFFFLDM